MTDFHLDVLRILRHPGAEYNLQRLDRTLITAPHVYGRSDGWDPGPVSRNLGPVLRELERAGLVRGDEHRTDRTRYTLYSITEAGRQHVDGLAVAAAVT